jgi:glycosyltransferase involved in cell wall biosynthesis
LRRIRTAVADVQGDLPELDLANADEWRIVVTHGNVPRAHVIMASPGEARAATLELTLRRAGERAREEADYRRSLTEPRFEPEPLRISVVIPTHRRPDVLVGLLASVTDLEPGPDEVIVVDNDPGAEDSRPLVDAVGFKYIREDRRGLNVARRTGLLAATGDIVVFTDDDCLVSPGWLAAIPELFADPLVAVAAGPGFAFELNTGAQLRREEEAGFAKGLAPRRFDWRTRAPTNAGAVGSGNSMAVRRDVAIALEVFPPELDAGTRAPAAGDLFAIFRLLSAGFDAVYEPRMLFWHRHSPNGLRPTIRNYGHGAGAFYTKVLVEERELPVLAVWYWFVRRWIEALLDVQSGLADRGRLRVRWCYLKASLMGPVAWRRALADLEPEGRRVLAASRAGALAPPPVAAPEAEVITPERPAFSVIIADRGEGAAALIELLDLEPEDELIIRPEPQLAEAWSNGAAVARRELLLFLDARSRPAAALIAAHARRHKAEPGSVVAGRTVFQPADRRLATLSAWRERVRAEPALLVDGNVSVAREQFERGTTGARVIREPAAIVAEPVACTTAEWVACAPRARLVAEPVACTTASAPVRAASVVALEALEWLRLRGAWAVLAARARREPPQAVDPRRRMTRAEWRAAAHAAAGRPGRTTPRRDASAVVVLGPAHGDAERRAARAAGFGVIEALGAADPVGHWRAVTEAIAETGSDVVALPLRGTSATEPWLSEMLAALEGTRVAAVVGAGLAREDPPSVLGLFSRATTRVRFSGAGSPPQFIAMRRDLYDLVGGIDPQIAELGWMAPVLDYVERALDSGLTIGRLDTHGVGPAGCHRPARSLGEWHRSWARGGLHAERARRLGGMRGAHAFAFAGVVPLLRFRRPDRTGRRSVRHAAGSLAAFLLGGAAAARRPQPRGREDV